MSIAIGDVLANRYRIVERLGRGGMAEVFQAVDQTLGREVAVKLLTERSDDVRRRFLLEAQSMAHLNHPNILAIYDVGVDRGVSFIILEHVRGKTLRELERSRLSIERTIDLMLQLLDALHYAHARGIIHRDVKPGNVIVTADDTVKVMDFGLARRMADVANLAQSGEIVGTLAYLPPERFLGRAGDRTGDLYSVGVILYELLGGAVPFPQDSDDLVAVMLARVNRQPHPLRQLNPEVPAELDRIVMRLLERDPAARYADATAVTADLRRFRRQLGLAAEIAPSPRAPSIGGGTGAADLYAAALEHVVSGMAAARRQRWRQAQERYAIGAKLFGHAGAGPPSV